MFYAPANCTYTVHPTYYFQAPISLDISIYSWICVYITHAAYSVYSSAYHFFFRCFCFSSSHFPLFPAIYDNVVLCFSQCFSMYLPLNMLIMDLFYMHDKIWYNVCKPYANRWEAFIYSVYLCRSVDTIVVFHFTDILSMAWPYLGTLRTPWYILCPP